MEPAELRISSDLTELARVSEFVAEHARRAGVSEQGIFEIQMATDEACTNAIEHAYAGQQGEVWISCWVEGDEFVVQVRDFGRRFDPDKVPEPDITSPLEERNIGGLGLFFMRALTDRIEFLPNGQQGNRVILRKNIGSRS